MNYTQAYKALRGYGIPADKARQLLEDAEASSSTTPGATKVTFSNDKGFTLTMSAPEKEDD